MQPTKSQAMVKHAYDLYREGNRQEAVDWLKKCELDLPEDMEIKYILGKFLIQNNKFKDGVQVLEELLKKKHGYLNALLELGHLYLKLGNIVKSSAYFQKAFDLYPKSSQVQVSFGAFYQRKGDLTIAVNHYRKGLELQLKDQVFNDSPDPKHDFKISAAEDMMWDTLSLLCKHGIHVFPAFGTLLGLVRNGGLMLHDKDIDVGLPFSEMDRAVKVLKNNGYKEVFGSFGYINPRAFVHLDSGITIDLSGFVVDSVTGKCVTAGAWLPGVPKDWNMIFEFSKVKLQKIKSPSGNDVWFIDDATLWLEEIYGSSWQVPDKYFDSMVRANNIASFSYLAECFAYSRIYSNWLEGNFRKAKVLAQATLERNKADKLISKIVSKLSD